jgi:hypothetical protein
MRQPRLRTVLIGTGAALALVAGGTAAYAVTTGPIDSSGVIHGCYTTTATNGSHKIVLQNVGTNCPSGTTAIKWNQKGPAGPQGIQGPQGPPGPQGPAGPGLLAWAYVNANGTVASSSGNVTVANPGAGSYCIGVTGGTAHVAVASLDSLENTGGTVQAGVFDASGCPANASNILVVTRPQSQDGGFPGVNHAFYIIVS